MLKYDFEASAGYWLTRTYTAYTHAVQQALAPQGITFRQAQVLAWISARGPLSQRELAEDMLIEPPNLVGVLDRMEAAKLIQRKPCDDDRRRKLIHPLPAAEGVWEKIASIGNVIREQAVKGMTKSECRELKALLEKMEENLSNLDTSK